MIISHVLYEAVDVNLRTSETNYLNEAYSFYAAIRGRAYYSRAAKEDRSDLMVKKLRYYARFIVVCLLLKKMKLVRDLVMVSEPSRVSCLRKPLRHVRPTTWTDISVKEESRMPSGICVSLHRIPITHDEKSAHQLRALRLAMMMMMMHLICVTVMPLTLVSEVQKTSPDIRYTDSELRPVLFILSSVLQKSFSNPSLMGHTTPAAGWRVFSRHSCFPRSCIPELLHNHLDSPSSALKISNELDNQISDYTSTYEPDDQLEWSLVLEEIKSFIKADEVVSVLHADSNTIVLSHRRHLSWSNLRFYFMMPESGGAWRALGQYTGQVGEPVGAAQSQDTLSWPCVNRLAFFSMINLVARCSAEGVASAGVCDDGRPGCPQYVECSCRLVKLRGQGLSPLTTPPVEKSPVMNLTLQEILIVGNCNDQAGVEPVDKEMAFGTELSDFDKGVIVGCHLGGLSSRVIARKMPTDLGISEEQLHISPISQAIKLGDLGGVWTFASGHWSSGHRFCGVMSRGLQYSGPMDVYGCGVYPGNCFCRSDDNARCHVSRATMQWYTDNNVRRFDWRAQSPDLNPIEHLWDELDRRVRARQARPKSIAKLMEWLQEEWRRIPVDVLQTLVESMPDRVKFSELTMDMFRMLQTLEREPQEDFNHIYDASPAPGRLPLDKGYSLPGSKTSYPLVSGCQENGDRPLRRENPHKYLLYKPTLSQVLVFLASGVAPPSVGGDVLCFGAISRAAMEADFPAMRGYLCCVSSGTVLAAWLSSVTHGGGMTSDVRLKTILPDVSVGFKELPPAGALLLYISADGCFFPIKHPEDMGYDLGGVLTSSKKEVDLINKKTVQLKEMHWCGWVGALPRILPVWTVARCGWGACRQMLLSCCFGDVGRSWGWAAAGGPVAPEPRVGYTQRDVFGPADGCYYRVRLPGSLDEHWKSVLVGIWEARSFLQELVSVWMYCKVHLYPGDLHPFTRKPLFIIVDSDNSFVFQNIPRYFGQPLVVLMSPQDVPPVFQDQQHNGNLFTLFLHSPLTAFCFICNILSVPIHLWERCQSYIDRFVTEASRLFTRCRIDPAYLQFFGDDFLRLLLLRYIFCDVVLHLHRAFKVSAHHATYRHLEPPFLLSNYPLRPELSGETVAYATS
ncbi:hypothetical protein PR048_032109 [Dryococelus australis]|uniref:Protein SCAI n=1 Tax=Dryococelus australis TaxID=614101 RepID=A0ABQ9G5F7_9NEOP|nr:hypothetical protein PR048_032109 [Dryococelus australis]